MNSICRLFLITALLFPNTGFTWVASPTFEKEHKFVFQMKPSSSRTPQEVEVFEFQSRAPSYEEAFEKAAQACFQHFKKGQKLSESRGLDIIDVCANPRSL